jgi:hypothetical protein
MRNHFRRRHRPQSRTRSEIQSACKAVQESRSKLISRTRSVDHARHRFGFLNVDFPVRRRHNTVLFRTSQNGNSWPVACVLQRRLEISNAEQRFGLLLIGKQNVDISSQEL